MANFISKQVEHTFTTGMKNVNIKAAPKQDNALKQHPANRTHNPQLHTRPTTWKPQHEIPQAATTV